MSSILNMLDVTNKAGTAYTSVALEFIRFFFVFFF